MVGRLAPSRSVRKLLARISFPFESLLVVYMCSDQNTTPSKWRPPARRRIQQDLRWPTPGRVSSGRLPVNIVLVGDVNFTAASIFQANARGQMLLLDLAPKAAFLSNISGHRQSSSQQMLHAPTKSRLGYSIRGNPFSNNHCIDANKISPAT